MKKTFSVDLTMNDEKVYLLLEGDEKGALILKCSRIKNRSFYALLRRFERKIYMCACDTTKGTHAAP